MKKNYKAIFFIIALSIILCLSWINIWRCESEIRKLEVKLADSRADVAELNGDMEDMRDVMKYDQAYSFHFVMNILTAKAA
ncbi:MAG: hypothetical protein WC374_14090, partial [Phycisphaerae bacterium]